MGGDNVVFWGPLAWTVIYGLLVATFLTLIFVPVMYFLTMKFKMWLRRKVKSVNEDLENGSNVQLDID